MYSKDLINKDNKIAKYYFAKMGRQISLSVYETHFFIIQEFGLNLHNDNIGKPIKYNLALLDNYLKKLKKQAKLLETIKYKSNGKIKF